MVKAIIFESELEFIARCAVDYPNIETGGDLFGFWTHSGYPSIQYVIGPGPKADRNPTAFYQDRDYLIEMGKRLRSRFGLQHIGEWHSHHSLGLKHPSGGDRDTIAKAIKKYGVNHFFLTICTLESKEVRVRGFHFSANQNNYETASWVILDGDSPIRKDFDSSNKNFIYKPKEKRVSYEAEPITTFEGELTNNTEEAPKFPEGSWMNLKEGRENLKSITKILKEQFDDVRIFQTEDKRIKLEVDAKGKQFVIIFPHNFPKNKPEINIISKTDGSIVDQFFEIMNKGFTWREDRYKTYITSYITTLYNIDQMTEK